MSMRTWIVPVVTAVAGVTVGFLIARDGGGEIAAPGSAVPAATHAATPGFTLDDVRRVVREELAARTPPEGAAPAARPGATAAVPDAAQSAAAARASMTLDGALARRTWSEADSDALRDDFSAMSSEQRSEWLRQFAMAVNQGRLVPENERAPF